MEFLEPAYELGQFYELYLPWCCMYDTEAVERNYKQYHAFCANDSNEERRHMLKSLYFMNLLANNNLSAFHCEVRCLHCALTSVDRVID